MSAAHAIGYIVMVASGFALASLLLAAAGWATGTVGAWLFKRLRRTYHLYTLGYWLAEMERNGTHKFPAPDEPHPHATT